MADSTRQKAKANADGESNAVLMSELKLINAKIGNMQNAMEKQVNAMEKLVDSKFDSLHGLLLKLISENQDALMKELEKTAKDLRHNLDLEVGILSARMDRIEQKIDERSVQGKPFDKEVSLVLIGLPQDDNEDIMAKVKDLLCNGLDCDPVLDAVAVERFRARGRKPGLVKVQLRSVQEKVSVLRRKVKLKESERFQRVYLSLAKSHAERLVDYNFRTFLRETPAGKDFYLAGNGRLVKQTSAGAPAEVSSV